MKSKGNILVVDDTPETLELLARLLFESGYQVQLATNGAMALASVALNPPDLILLDIMMPDLDGYTVCQHLKASEQSREIPVIFVSAKGEVVDKVQGFEMGGVDYITKPYQSKEILARIENQLRNYRLSRQLAEQNARLQKEISDRLQAESALRESESKFRSAFEDAAIGMALVGIDGKWLQVNQSLCKILGYSEPEFLDLTLQTLTLPEDWDLSAELFERSLKGELRTYQIEQRYIHKQGYPVSTLLTISLVRDAHSQPLYFVSQIQDISLRQKQQQELAKYAAQYYELYNNAPCGYCSIAQSGTFILINNTFLNWLGYTREEIIGKKNFSDLLATDSLQAFNSKFLTYKQSGNLPALELNLLRKDGTVLPVILNCKAIKDPEGNFVMGRSTILDMEEHKRVETALKETLTLQQAILESANYAIIATGANGIILTFNLAAERMLGYTATEVIGEKTPVLLHEHQELAERARELSTELEITIEPGFEALVAKARRGVTEERQWTYIRKDGSHFSVQLSVTALLGSQGNTTGFLAIASDISDRKRAEEEQRKFVALVENSSDFIAMSTQEGNLLYLNDAGRELVGLNSFKEIRETNLSDCYTPESWAFLQERALPVVMTKGSWQGEARICHFQTHQLTDLQVNIFLIEHPQTGKPMCLATVGHDITERQRTAAQIKVSEERFQLVARATNDAVWDWDIETNHLWLGPGYQTLFGYKASEIQLMLSYWSDKIHPEDRDRVLSQLETVLKSHENTLFIEYQFLRANGSWADVWERSYVIRNPQGQPVRMIGAIVDISDRKQAEAALQKAR
ncbi:MAG: PAS domain S-box protein, partial [Actinomycetota bacterium]